MILYILDKVYIYLRPDYRLWALYLLYKIHITILHTFHVISEGQRLREVIILQDYKLISGGKTRLNATCF
jgi:hypothetical protein